MRGLRLFLVIAMIPSVSTAQGFTCGIGDRAACLGYGDTVCSSMGKCVSSDAVCFDRYQCDYEGFTCKSNVTDCVNDYNNLNDTYNVLVDDYNELLEQAQDLNTSFDDALSELQRTQRVLFSVEAELEDTRSELQEARDQAAAAMSDRDSMQRRLRLMQDCIQGLGRFSDPQSCLR